MHQLYLDHAATTPIKAEVLETMLPYLSNFYGNASSVYSLARNSKQAIENAREKIASLLGAQPKEIFFTASGTEADNWALKGLAYAHQDKGRHIITSQIEHHAVLHSCQFLEKNGFEVTYLPVDEFGLISLEDLKEAIRPDTILISIMFANNEIGTISPISEIAQLAKEKNIIFHTDGVQAVANLEIDVKKLGIDAMSISGHKFYAPKGIGALYLKNGLAIENLLHGGSQERELRASTENVASIVGMAKALDLAYLNFPERIEKMKTLRDMTIKEILANFPKAKLNGHPIQRLAGNVNFSFPGVEGDVLLMQLDMKGIAASSGSACSSLSIEPSHVLLALGLSKEMAKSSLRLTFGDENTKEDVNYLINTLKEVLS